MCETYEAIQKRCIDLDGENNRLKENLTFAENKVNELSERLRNLPSNKEDADARVDRALAKSQRLLDEVNARESGRIFCAKCERELMSLDDSHVCQKA